MASTEFKFDGHRICYTDSGPTSSAPVIVFIHGWASSRKVYARLISHFRTEYRCVALDLLGHGESDAPLPSLAGEDIYSLSGLAKSIDVLLSHLSIKRATFVGWSLGSAIALTIGLTYPQIVENLILVATSPVLFLPSDDDDFPGMPRSQVEPFLALVKTDYKAVYENFVLQEYPEATPESRPDYVTEAIDDAALLSPDIAHLLISLSGNTDFRERVHEVKARALIINGAEDKLCPPSAGEWMHEHLGGESVLMLYESCGHVPFAGPTAERFAHDMAVFLHS
jgi:pimeloyl-ACP methyl ester carboxylesterase